MVRSHNPFIPSAILLLTLAGCGVPYAEIGDSGGHKTVPIGNDQFEITYLSNRPGGQPSNRMQELTLLRAAEVSLKYGFSHFVVEDEFASVQTKWTTRSTTTPIGSGGISSRGTTIGGSPSGGIGLGGSAGGIGIGSSGGGLGSSGGTVTSSTPVPVAIPELSIRIRCHHGVPSTAYKGVLYDAARIREMLAMQYNIDISEDNPPARPPPKIQVIE